MECPGKEKFAVLSRGWYVSSSFRRRPEVAQSELRDGQGSFCLIGAIDRLRCDDLTLRYLVRVARTRHERCPFGQPVLAVMNDHCSDFEEFRDCLREALALAAADQRQSTILPQR